MNILPSSFFKHLFLPFDSCIKFHDQLSRFYFRCASFLYMNISRFLRETVFIFQSNTCSLREVVIVGAFFRKKSISPLHSSFIPHGHRVSAYITSKFKLQQYASGYTWGHVDEDGKDFYFKEFLKMYTWQTGKEEEFKATWNLYCQVQYKKLLHKWRKMSHPPSHVPVNIWSAWKIVWGEEKWKKKSETARNNRNIEVAGPGTGVTKHTSGSRSIIEHTLKLEADLKRKTDCWEVFRSTHCHKDGTFVDARSQAIDDNMTEKITETSQAATEGEEPHAPSQDDINNIYYEVVGGMKKSCIYGLGSQAKVVFPHAVPTSTGRGRPSSSSVEIQELRAENTDLRARVTELDGKMREFMARMVFSQTLDRPAFPDFSSPIIDSDETQAP